MSRLQTLRNWFRRQVAHRRPEPRAARPLLERLECRLPPGDLLNLALLGWPDPLASQTAKSSSKAAFVDPYTAGSAGSSTSTSSTTVVTSSPSQPATPSSTTSIATPNLLGGTTSARSPAPASSTSSSAANPSGGGNSTLVYNPPPAPVVAGLVKKADKPVPPKAKPRTPAKPPVKVLKKPKVPVKPTIQQPPANPSSPLAPSNPSAPNSPPPTQPAPPSNPVAGVQITAVRERGVRNVMGILTNDRTPTVIGTGPARKSVTVYLDGKALGNVTAGADGAWSLKTSSMVDGWHNLSAVPTGVKQPAVPQAKVNVDTLAPVVGLKMPEFLRGRDQATADVSVSNPDSNGNDPKIHIDVDLNNNGSYTDTGEVDFATNTSTSLPLPALPEGTFKVQARVKDFAGNTGAAEALVQVDPWAGILGNSYLRKLAGMPDYDPDNPTAPWDPTEGSGSPTSPETLAEMQKVLVMQDDNVLIETRATLGKYMTDFKKQLGEMGLQFIGETPASNLVTGWLPIGQLRNLESVPSFSGAVPVYIPITKAGSVESEGDAVMRAPEFRNTLGVDGSGVKVGVISDSADRFGLGLGASQRTGDLPNVQVLREGPPNASDEGRAMLEIVHDVAPGAKLAFYSGSFGPADFARGIHSLADAGSNVITDDLGYFNSPAYSAGRMGQAADYVSDHQNVVYTTAAGNDGSYGFRTNWRSIDRRVGGVNGTYLNINETPLQRFTLPNTASMLLSVSWNQSYLEGGDPRPAYQVPTNIDVFILRIDTGAIVARFNNINQNTDEANEVVAFTNTLTTPFFALAFRLVSGPAPTRLAWIGTTSGNRVDINAQYQGAPTIFGQTLAHRAVTVAAADALAPGVPESFTALGGALEIFFNDENGLPVESPVRRAKPDVTGPDGVSTTFFAPPFAVFFGTSAAAPHVAGAAALLLSQVPGARSQDIFDHLRASTTDLEGPGFDPYSGDGLVQLTPLMLGPGPYEANETSDAAYDFGQVTAEGFGKEELVLGFWPNGLPDYDWFKFAAGQDGRINVVMNNNRLEAHIFLGNGSLLTEVGNGSPVAVGQTFYVEVKGRTFLPSILTQGQYSLQVTVGG